MENWKQIFADLERQDVHRTLAQGMPEDVQKQLSILCAAYRSAGPEDKAAIKAGMTAKATWMTLTYAEQMAEVAMQRKDTEALDLGIVAFDLSDIMRIDHRDAFGPAGQLSFAAQACGVDVMERVTAIIGDVSPQLMSTFEEPKMPRVERDSEGNLIFWKAWRKT